MKRCWAAYALWLVIALPGFGGMLGACGQKGDLYLPPPDEASQSQDKSNKKP